MAGVSLVLTLALGGHLFAALSVAPAESRTVLRPVADVVEALIRGDHIDEGDADEPGDDGELVGRAAALEEALAAFQPVAKWAASSGLRRIQRPPSEGSVVRAAAQQRLDKAQEDWLEQNATTKRAQIWPSDWKPPTDWRALATQKRSAALSTDLETTRNNINNNNNVGGHKFIYVVSPFSGMVHPFQAERFAQGYDQLLPLSENYATGLQKSARVKPTSGRFSPIKPFSGDSSREELSGCKAKRELIQLSRDDADPLSGQLVRRCSGSVELNVCEGACASGVQPSIKSSSGLVKSCSCCNEGAFRRVQVRLNRCSRMLVANSQEEVQRLETGSGSFMDVEVDEPIDCKCRACDSLV